MGSPQDQNSPPRGTLALVFLVALPLMALVTVVLFRSTTLKEPPAHPRAIVEPAKTPPPERPAVIAKPSDAPPRPPPPSPVQPPVVVDPRPPSKSAQAGPSPWQTALDLAGEPPGYTSIAFLPFEEAFDRPDRDDLTPWFERTPSAGFRVNKIASQYGKSGTIEGIGRLRSPWPADGVLRLQLDNFNRLKMHFFFGLTGVTLVYYEEQGNRWAAYATTRGEGQPTPKTLAITATDDDRCRRTELRFGGPIELRYRENDLILSRGDVVLLTAPLAGPPSDVFFEGRATVHGIALARTKDAPTTAQLTHKRNVRQLSGLSSLAQSGLIERAPVVLTANSLAEWLPEAMNHKPAEIETAEWLRACTIRTLGAGAPQKLAYPLLESLLDDAAQRNLPFEQQLAALDDAMLLALDFRDRSAMRVGILSRYAQLGLRAANDRGLPAWSSVRSHYHAAPALTDMQIPTDLDRAIRWELVSAAYTNKPHESLDFLARLRFFHQLRDPSNHGLADWVLWLATRHSTDRTAESQVRLKDSWREPLVEELSKDTYNALTELKAVLESESWDDAARLLTSLHPQAASGVAPYGTDRALLTSLPVAIQLTLEDYPQVRDGLDEKITGLARLRIAQAINAGDAATIELATVQFAGTPAAAEAHRWLGDRALAAGHFMRAITEFERARAQNPALDEEILPRIRLAASMLGREAGSPPTAAVQFGAVSISPADFESLVAEMRSRLSTSASLVTKEPLVPKPAGFTAHVRGRLDGPSGERPQEEVGRRTNQLRVPWADRQIATTVEGELMYVANRFHVAAYRLTTGERIWQSQSPPGQMQRAQEWAMIPMRPLVAGDRIFVRLLYSPGPLLACLEKSSGKLLWVAENRDREFFTSDPLLIDGQLAALGISIEPDQEGLLRFFTLDPQTGETLRQRDLVRLRGTWGSRGCCEVTAHEDGLAVALGGVVVGLDAAGTVRWVRSQLTLPSDDDPRWVLQMNQPPLAKNGRLYVAQPGVRTIECLSAATGRRYWSAVLPEVIGIVGIAENLLVVRTEAGIRALDLADGATQWRYDADNLFSFQLVDAGRLLFAGREPVPNSSDNHQVRLTWLNSANGKPTATTVLPNFADNDPRLGPIVPHKDRLFTFFGRGQHDPTREIIELLPTGEADRVLPQPDAWHQRPRRP